MMAIAQNVDSFKAAWCEDEEMKLTVVDVIEKLGVSFGASFSPYVADLCPYLLKVVQTDRSVERRLTCKVKHLAY